jgi:hypothetical protein
MVGLLVMGTISMLPEETCGVEEIDTIWPGWVPTLLLAIMFVLGNVEIRLKL